jgi:LacI family transcriptional regulator
LKRIAVVLEGRVDYEREVLRGIRDHATPHGDWLLHLEPPGRHLPRFLRDWQPHGILFQAEHLSPDSLRAVVEQRCPAVHLSDSHRELKVPCVGLDNEAVGRMAAEHLSRFGWSSFAFVGVRGRPYSKRRCTAFSAFVTGSVATTELPSTTLKGWLAKLPRPCALFAANDQCSLQVITLCRELGLRVPEEIAVLGVGDDSLICEFARPQMSSIAVPSRQVGVAAAQRLEECLGGGRRRRSTLLAPGGVISRQSTDLARTEDDHVSRALRFIRENFARRINVADVLREVGVSRRLLERRFRQALGVSPLHELQQARLERARHLLLTTDAPLSRIAAQCGYTNATQLVTAVKRATGRTPGQIRQQR